MRQVLSTRKAFVVKARSASERQAWVEALSKAIEDYHLLRRQSSDKLSVRAAEAAGPSSSSAGAVGGQQGRFAAVWVPDSQSKSCGLCTKEFTLLVRRHHCRVCGSLVCNACSPHRLRVEAIDPKRAVRVCTSCKDSNTTVTVEQDEDQEGQGEDGGTSGAAVDSFRLQLAIWNPTSLADDVWCTCRRLSRARAHRRRA